MDNKDIFIKKEFKFIIAHDIQSQVLETLKRKFKITEILVVEPKALKETPLSGYNGIVKDETVKVGD